LYRVLFFPLLFIFLPSFIRKILKRGGYTKTLHHHFGLIPKLFSKDLNKKRIWIQAVSVGEILAINALLKEFAADKEIEIVLTTTTSTAYAIAKRNYGQYTAKIGIFPLDFWLFSHIAWQRIKPDIAIMVENELWPEHIYQAKKRNVPVIVINARMSDRSYYRYGKVRIISALLLKHITAILACSQQDYKRFIEMGAPKATTSITGNLKFDASIRPLFTAEKIDSLKQETGFFEKDHHKTQLPLIIFGASTWPGEEEALVCVFEQALKEKIDCRLFLVPRHAERRKELYTLLCKTGYPFHFRTYRTPAPYPTMIYVGDTTGELMNFAQLADIVFVGKSLPPNNGGQNPVEIAALGKSIVFGPNMTNFRQISDSLIKKKAAVQVKDTSQLKQTFQRLLQAPQERQRMGELAQQWHAENQGATEKTAQIIRSYMRF
jgi:3-deoxy-D-manno-octulosonic-acid transferase